MDVLRKVSFLTQNDCYKAAAPLSPAGIVVHSTGCDQKRISAYRWQFDRPGQKSAVHGIIGLDDNGELSYEQWLPYHIQCWGCGSGEKGSFNRSHIQFEICETLADGDWCRETYAAALLLCTELCRAFGISPDNVVCHSEAHALGYGSNHGDVMHWWPQHGLSMDKFREELKDQMYDTEDNYQVFKAFMERYNRETQTLPASAYAEESCRKAIGSGLFTDGDGDGSLDYPQAPVKRQELAAVLDRAGLLG